MPHREMQIKKMRTDFSNGFL